MNVNNENIINIKDLKKNYFQARESIRKSFFSNYSGIKNNKQNSDLIDKIISKIFFKIEKKNKKIFKKFSITAVGGYGRKQLAPYSDIDLLFIHDLGNLEIVEEIVKEFLYPLWDLGLKIGYAVRSLKESITFSEKDQIIKTTMLDIRLICGSKDLFDKLLGNFFEKIKDKTNEFINEKIEEREQRIKEIGFDYFKNEPNLKGSEGSLRDLNLINWCIKALAISNYNNLNSADKLLTNNEKKKIRNGLEFLLTLRSHLHYESKRPNDKLTFDYQKIIAEKFSTKQKNSVNTKVEVMMNKYFKQIGEIKILTQNLSKNFLQSIKEKEKINIDNYSKIKNEVRENFFAKFDNLKFQRCLINYFEKIKSKDFRNKKNISEFKKILFSDSNEKFIRLCEIGVVGKIIPEFSRIQNLTQFDRYHALTVGQHTLKALTTLKELKNSKNSKGLYGFSKMIFMKNFSKKPLFYATLLHDIGKGLGGNHNQKGAEIARKIVLELDESDYVAYETSWLIENHLILSDFAFKKDIEDDSIIKKISETIYAKDRLNALFLLTVSDISAVDHGIWNEWKANLLESLYKKILEEINIPKIDDDLNKKIEKLKRKILSTSEVINKNQLQSFSKITYPDYWLLQSPEEIKFQIENFFLNTNSNRRFDFFVNKKKNKNFFELTLITNDRPSLFLDLISIFVAENISVFEARIFTLEDNTVIDTFKFSFSSVYKLKEFEIDQKIKVIKKKIMNMKESILPKYSIKKFKKVNFLKKKIDIKIDNNSSSTYTVMEVVTNDRVGLLYGISKILIKNNIIISMAKISTNGDFVEDSFHLRNNFGFKIKDKLFIAKLKKEIVDFLS